MTQEEVSEWVRYLCAFIPNGHGWKWKSVEGKKPVCDLYIGSPAAGKSRIMEDRREVEDRILVSQDAIAKLLTPDVAQYPEDRYRYGKMIANAYLDRMFKEKRSVMIEGTGVNLDACSELLKKAKERGYRTRVVWVRAPLSLCLDRNGSRECPLPKDVVIGKWFVSEAHAPLLGEEAHEFITINNGGS